MQRRDFLVASLAAGGSLLLGFEWEPVAAGPDRLQPNAYLRLDPDGTVTVLVPRSEMGQGVYTALPALVAEELDADWRQVRVEAAPASKAYRDRYDLQATSGSTSVRDLWLALRQAGAAARQMLIAAAAAAWGVPPEECYTSAGTVSHPGSDRKIAYGPLARAAASLPVPRSVALKEPSAFTLIGKSLPRTDSLPKVTGQAAYGLDVRPAGCLIARVLMPPRLGAKLKAFDGSKALALRGVRQVFPVSSPSVPAEVAGIAVVAETYPAATAGLEALQVVWDPGPLRNLDDAGIERVFRSSAGKAGVLARSEGNAQAAIARVYKVKTPGKRRVITAEYLLPYLAHATMEPPNCTAHVHDGWVDLWVGTQAQSECQKAAARIAGVPQERVRVHTQFLGCGFGRRLEVDFVAQAVEIARRTGKPVKLVWSREDDLRHDAYRPGSFHKLIAATDGRELTAWSHKLVSPSIYARKAPHWIEEGIDETAVEGAASFPYGVPNVEVRHVPVDPGIPTGYWRSVGFSCNGFAVEAFMDRIAAHIGQDPVAFRVGLLARTSPRLAAVVELAAAKADWGKPLPAGRFRGVACVSSYGSFVAQVVEISLRDGHPRVHRVVCAVDCGRVINPGIVEAQMQGGIVFGLCAALRGQVSLEAGRVRQGNFDTYPVLRMSETPDIEVHIVPSQAAAGGVGEPGVPPVAPALASALAAAGREVSRLPVVPARS
jgi:isoquinoline 1-oxidoreductase beta subunit